MPIWYPAMQPWRRQTKRSAACARAELFLASRGSHRIMAIRMRGSVAQHRPTTGRVQDGSQYAQRQRHASQHCTQSQGWHASRAAQPFLHRPDAGMVSGLSRRAAWRWWASTRPRRLQRSPDRRLCSQPRPQLRPLPSYRHAPPCFQCPGCPNLARCCAGALGQWRWLFGPAPLLQQFRSLQSNGMIADPGPAKGRPAEATWQA